NEALLQRLGKGQTRRRRGRRHLGQRWASHAVAKRVAASRGRREKNCGCDDAHGEAIHGAYCTRGSKGGTGQCQPRRPNRQPSREWLRVVIRDEIVSAKPGFCQCSWPFSE